MIHLDVSKYFAQVVNLRAVADDHAKTCQAGAGCCVSLYLLKVGAQHFFALASREEQAALQEYLDDWPH